MSSTYCVLLRNRNGLRGRGIAAKNRQLALPLIFRLRATSSPFFHFGRFAGEVETVHEVLERIQGTRIIETWLYVHSERLVRHTWDCFRSKNKNFNMFEMDKAAGKKAQNFFASKCLGKARLD